MTEWARIENGTVVEVIDFDPEGKYHPDLAWEEVPDGTVQGSTKNADGVWVAPEGPEEPPDEPDEEAPEEDEEQGPPEAPEDEEDEET